MLYSGVTAWEGPRLVVSPTDGDGRGTPEAGLGTVGHPDTGSKSEAEAMFTSVVVELHQALYAMAVAITANRAVAEDAVAGVYASTWPRFKKGDIAELDRYLWRATARQARRAAVLHRRHLAPFPPSSPIDPADVVTADLSLADLLSKLPAKQRTVVALCHVAGFSEPETAELLSIPLGTVKSRLARAAQLLRSRYPDARRRRGLDTRRPEEAHDA